MQHYIIGTISVFLFYRIGMELLHRGFFKNYRNRKLERTIDLITLFFSVLMIVGPRFIPGIHPYHFKYYLYGTAAFFAFEFITLILDNQQKKTR